MKEFTIRKNEANQRLDKYIHKVWSEAPNSLIYKLLRKKTITRNDRKADAADRLEEGDVIRFYVTDETFAKFQGTGVSMDRTGGAVGPGGRTQGRDRQSSRSSWTGQVQVLYADENLLLVNKPWGVLSQKASPSDYSMAEYAVDYALEQGLVTEEELVTFRPGVCSRLDRNTSGILTAGLSMAGLQQANELIRRHELDKYYLAIVKGHMPKKEDVLKANHTKDHAKNQVRISSESEGRQDMGVHEIVTGYQVLAEGKDASLLRVHLITGQTHQIRAHFASIGHPLAGDLKYGNAEWNAALKQNFHVGRQMLHAYEVTFPKCGGALEQVSGRTVTCSPPRDFMNCLVGLQIPWTDRNI